MMTPEQQVDLDLREYEGRLSEWDDSPAAEIRLELLLRGGAWGSVENPCTNTCRGYSYCCSGSASGCGYGGGYGYGKGSALGFGGGRGISSGYGSGSGIGYGSGYGSGDGDGDGYGSKKDDS